MSTEITPSKPQKGLVDTITPQKEYPELARAIYAEFSGKTADKTPFNLYLKREDLHPYGSHKGRSISYMIDHYINQGQTKFVISSSGNAALAAVRHINSLNRTDLELTIYCGLHITSHKLGKIQDSAKDNSSITIRQVERPLQALNVELERRSSRGETAISLRQSTDDVALVGYRNLTDELSLIPELTSVFIGTSSGTTAMALVENLKAAINIVQTTSCHPIATAMSAEATGSDENFDDNSVSIADAIVDKVALRAKILSPLLQASGGTAYIADNHSIVKAQGLVEQHTGIKISPNSALSIVGLCNMAYTETPTGSVVCVVTGD